MNVHFPIFVNGLVQNLNSKNTVHCFSCDSSCFVKLVSLKMHRNIILIHLIICMFVYAPGKDKRLRIKELPTR